MRHQNVAYETNAYLHEEKPFLSALHIARYPGKEGLTYVVLDGVHAGGEASMDLGTDDSNSALK